MILQLSLLLLHVDQEVHGQHPKKTKIQTPVLLSIKFIVLDGTQNKKMIIYKGYNEKIKNIDLLIIHSNTNMLDYFKFCTSLELLWHWIQIIITIDTTIISCLKKVIINE